MRKLELVVWDGDGTLWDWMSYAVPAYEAMCDEIASIAGKSSDETAAAMKAYYTTVGTMEDERLVQGLNSAGFFNHIKDFDINNCIRRAQSTFAGVRTQKLKVYDGIPVVMGEIHDRGIPQILLSDAIRSQAQLRLRFSKLGKYIKEIHCMPSAPSSDIPAEYRRVHSDLVVVHELPNEKPHIDLEKVVRKTRKQIKEGVVIIGDNDSKDMVLADLYECLGIKAKYGATTLDLIRRIKRFAPDSAVGRNTQVLTAPLSDRIRIANSPMEILKYLQ